MKIDVKKIGKVQLALGIVLLLVVIIGSIICVKSYFFEPLVKGSTDMISTWGDVSEGLRDISESTNTTTTSMSTVGFIVSDLSLIGIIFKTSLAVFAAAILILLSLSLMLILQGLANINRK